MPTGWPQLTVQAALVLCGVVLALWMLVGYRSRRSNWTNILWAAPALLLGLTLATFRGVSLADRAASSAQLANSIPLQDSLNRGFVSSNSCQACHPGQYDTWHQSYHRTMTQPASPRSILAPLDNVVLENRGRKYHVQRIGDEHWVDMVDPDWEHDRRDKQLSVNVPNPPRVRKRIVMTTGSHHQQTWWVAGNQPRKLYNLPFMYLIEDRRIVPREDVFLRPPNAGRSFDVWNNNCIECHSVAGEQNYKSDIGVYDTAVAELGISCEACHGPGAAHIAANHNPARRMEYRRNDAFHDPTIVNPRQLDSVASSYVCGQCHGMNILKTQENKNGLRYRAGGDLAEVKMILRTDDDRLTESDRADWPRLKRHIDKEIAKNPRYLDDRFWPDGMVRVSGREHSAMVESACFSTHELSCLSCHSMHSSSPNDQLGSGMETNQACLQCHAEFSTSEKLTAHTHHAPSSSGSECYNCHMPHTTYGLLKAIRSHHIDSPSVQSSISSGRPNACNLCHLNETLQFAADHLHDWYDQPVPNLDRDQQSISAAVLWALRGDAGQRALIAWHMGWPAAKQASGQDWIAPYLAHLLNDPYPAVRYIAQRSLRQLPQFERFQYDFIAPAHQLLEQAKRAKSLWKQHRQASQDRSWTGDKVLLNADGSIQSHTFDRLSSERDERLMDLRE
jgi:predicted CXXCH cytochrome family protein